MRFARWVFTAAGIYGLITVTPLYFVEAEYARRSGPLTHPEWFYGFLGVVLAFQLLYLLIGRDPVRYRPVMLVALLAKLGFGVTMLALFLLGRTPAMTAVVAAPDLVWAGFFAAAYLRTPRA
jgi:hypothetical protein